MPLCSKNPAFVDSSSTDVLLIPRNVLFIIHQGQIQKDTTRHETAVTKLMFFLFCSRNIKSGHHGNL